MKRDSLAAVLLALLAVVALGAAAATLDSAVSLGGGGFGGAGSAPGTGGEGGTGISPSPSGEAAFSLPVVCYEFLREPPALALFVGIVVGFGALAYRDTGSAFACGAVAAAVGFPLGSVWWLLSACRPLDAEVDFSLGAGGADSGLFPESGEGGSGLGGAGEGAVSAPELLFALVVVVALLASAVALLAAAGDDDSATGGSAADEDDATERSPDLAAVGRAAGDAAGRIEGSPDAENEVYRAWRDMTEALDVDRPASSTPAEFASAAVAAGVDEEPVDELTAVFERVRYGGEDATADRERRAVAALRRIEERHGGGE
ncbi:hypothetical protein C461_14900 [Halorubrum aidingense JCM 13560]|uniref:Protein-glutamine gamma-glutamyltransferase-like C-terminal domain-containing protein n=1 Tax=Halorubrum aidingense JCM 13560 TaxID=1230454 RepID=M0P8J5_9EURY|nr:DUF4129 domain-containing protein [Halorubrum aidingense]EMA65140.1 hypothetical protein C461_14900 [Halorubrum aidingense JCM 13560]